MIHAAKFELHPRLAADCLVLGDLPVSRVLLMNDDRFPWCILVPRQPQLKELHDVPAGARAALFDEIAAVSRALAATCAVDKINVGALGNIVPQLHVHVIGRRPGDPAWPGPVWGFGAATAYEPAALRSVCDRLRRALDLTPFIHEETR
jgi:diadenosine tetraphosphate (Ap4A) HIT family hydrolase